MLYYLLLIFWSTFRIFSLYYLFSSFNIVPGCQCSAKLYRLRIYYYRYTSSILRPSFLFVPLKSFYSAEVKDFLDIESPCSMRLLICNSNFLYSKLSRCFICSILVNLFNVWYSGTTLLVFFYLSLILSFQYSILLYMTPKIYSLFWICSVL